MTTAPFAPGAGLFASLAEAMDDAVVTLDPSFRIRSWSPGAERLLGWSSDEALGRDVRTLIASHLGPHEREAMSVRILTEPSVRATVTRMCKDGRTIRADALYKALRDEAGEVRGLLIVARDVSAQMDALEQREARAAKDAKVRAFREAPVAMLVSDMTGAATDVNPAWESLYGIRAEDARGSGWAELFFPEDRDAALVRWRGLVAEGRTVRHRRRYRRRADDGAWVERWTDVVATPRIWGEGPERGYVALSFDVTDDVARERRLAEADAHLRAYFQAPGVGIVVTRGGERLLDVNEAFCKMLGYGRDEILERGWRALTLPEHLGEDEAAVATLLRGEVSSLQREKRYLRKDGTPLWADVSLSAVDRPNGGFDIVAIVQDIQLRKAFEADLRQREERLQTVLSTMADGVIVQEVSGHIVSCNGAAERILGLTRAQIEGRVAVDPRWHVVHEDGSPFPGEEHPTSVTLRTGESQSQVVMGVTTPEGEQRWISISSEALRHAPGEPPYGVVATFSDVTELRRDQDALREALANVKTLSGYLPICMFCHKIRDDAGYWQQLEAFISDRSNAKFSHGVCMECGTKHFPDL